MVMHMERATAALLLLHVVGAEAGVPRDLLPDRLRRPHGGHLNHPLVFLLNPEHHP